jgi:hypothetical protein
MVELKVKIVNEGSQNRSERRNFQNEREKLEETGMK